MRDWEMVLLETRALYKQLPKYFTEKQAARLKQFMKDGVKTGKEYNKLCSIYDGVMKKIDKEMQKYEV